MFSLQSIHTHSNGINITAEHRQYTGKIDWIYTKTGPWQADFCCLFKITTSPCPSTYLLLPNINLWFMIWSLSEQPTPSRYATHTVHWFRCAYMQFYVGKDMRCTVYFKGPWPWGDTTVSHIVQHWAPPKKLVKTERWNPIPSGHLSCIKIWCISEISLDTVFYLCIYSVLCM